MSDRYIPSYGSGPKHGTAHSSPRSPSVRDSDISGDDSRSRRATDLSHGKGRTNFSEPQPPIPTRQGSRNDPRGPVPWTKPAASRESMSSASTQEAISSIAHAISEALPSLFNAATDTLVLKSQRMVAQKELKKKREDYIKSQPNHDKFPSTEESQRRARDHAEKICKSIDEDIKAREGSIRDMSTLALAKALPNIIPKLLEAVESIGNSRKSDKRYEDLEKRSLKLERQLDEQREVVTELKAANYNLQAQYADLQRRQRDDVEDLKRKQRECDAQNHNSKRLHAELNDNINLIREIKSKDERRAKDTRRDIDSLVRGQADLSQLRSAIPADLQHKLDKIDEISTGFEAFKNHQQRLESRAENIETNLSTNNSCIGAILADQKKFGEFYEQNPDPLKAIKAIQSQITTLDQRIENTTGLENRIADIARTQAAESIPIPSTPTPQLNDLRDQLEDLKDGQDAMGDTWGKVIDELRDSHSRRLDSLESTFTTFSGVYEGKIEDLKVQCKSDALAIASLEARYIAINTEDIFKAMSEQFTQEQFPKLEQLRASIHNMAPRLAELENLVRNHWILPPVVEERIRVVEKEYQRHSELVQKIQSNQPQTDAENHGMELSSLASDMDNIKTQLSQMNQLCDRRLTACAESFGEVLASQREDILAEIGNQMNAVNHASKKRKFSNSQGVSPNPSLSMPSCPGSSSVLENERKKQGSSTGPK